MRFQSSSVLAVVLVAAVLSTASCTKKDPVRFSPYGEGAVSMARALDKPILIYATADW